VKYLRAKKSGVKIKIAPNQQVEVMMCNVVRVEEKYSSAGRITGGIVTIMTMTGKELLYQNNSRMASREKYVVDMLNNDRQFHITDDFNFVNIT